MFKIRNRVDLILRFEGTFRFSYIIKTNITVGDF